MKGPIEHIKIFDKYSAIVTREVRLVVIASHIKPTVKPPNKGPAILSFVGRFSSSWKLKIRGVQKSVLCPFLGGSFIRGSTVHYTPFVSVVSLALLVTPYRLRQKWNLSYKRITLFLTMRSKCSSITK